MTSLASIPARAMRAYSEPEMAAMYGRAGFTDVVVDTEGTLPLSRGIRPPGADRGSR